MKGRTLAACALVLLALLVVLRVSVVRSARAVEALPLHRLCSLPRARPVVVCTEAAGTTLDPAFEAHLQEGSYASVTIRRGPSAGCSLWYANLAGEGERVARRRQHALVLRVPPGVPLLVSSAVGDDLKDAITVGPHQTRHYLVHGGVRWTSLEWHPSVTLQLRPECNLRVLQPGLGWWLLSNADAHDDAPWVRRAQRYAQRWGYGLAVLDSNQMGAECIDAGRALVDAFGAPLSGVVAPSWSKLAALKHLLMHETLVAPGGWVLWLDKQAFITNASVSLAELVARHSERHALLLGQDTKEPHLLNVGAMLVRKVEATVPILESIWRMGHLHGWLQMAGYFWDQNAWDRIVELLQHFPTQYALWEQHVRLLPQRVLFSMYRTDNVRDLRAGHWRRGDFIAMCSGLAREAAAAHEATDFEPYAVRATNRDVPQLYALSLDDFFPTQVFWLDIAEPPLATHPMNPSCLADGDGYTCVVRHVNYEVDPEVIGFQWPAYAETVNVLVHVSHSQLPVRAARSAAGYNVSVSAGERLLSGPNVRARLTERHYEGFEDVRLVRVRGVMYGVATTSQLQRTGHAEIALLHLRGRMVEEAQPIRFEGSQLVAQKNWMPFESDDGELHLVYRVDPLVILRAPLGVARDGVVRAHKVYADDMRRFDSATFLAGTSGGIPWHRGHLFLVHDKSVSRGLVYLHRFLYIAHARNHRFGTRLLSRPFYLHRRTLEYAIGLQPHPLGLLLSFGFQDKQAAVAVLQVPSHEALFEHPSLWTHMD